MTTACLHAPADVLSACGFGNRSAAQELFFIKARLLHDLAPEDDPLLMLQVSLIMCMVILDHPTDRDYGYWFHNAISLATKLNVRDIVLESTKPREVLRPYRKIWWALYTLDIFHVFLNIRRSRLLEDSPKIDFRMEDDWKDEDVSGGCSSLLAPVTPQQMASPVVFYEMSRICMWWPPAVLGSMADRSSWRMLVRC
ncbi:hypothetical protein Daus18300_008455 [Diaporthe australafricana]|uniref:Xylanolytic transcriptional activator regulatory domain-containing protein n=1 Tax=Diaporthe australafricana TaxID=127596 RepID=A0ABR3WI64_9PEZI